VTWNLLSRLGPGAFETISGEVVKAILITLTKNDKLNDLSGLVNNNTSDSIDNIIAGYDVSECKSAEDKANNLSKCDIISVHQAEQIKNPDIRLY